VVYLEILIISAILSELDLPFVKPFEGLLRVDFSFNALLQKIVVVVA
jgi:hypothetical protein